MSPSPTEPAFMPTGDDRWLTRGVAGIGTASTTADIGREVPTALLPSLLTSTLGAPAAALGLGGDADGRVGEVVAGQAELTLGLQVGLHRMVVGVF